jgi:uncharacterized protein
VTPDIIWQLTLAFAFAAALYGSVGHGGASAYLAIMALLYIEQAVARPTALVLNLFVSSIAWWLFTRQTRFSTQLFLPLAIAAVPMAFIGGGITLPVNWYRPVVGVILLIAAAQLLWQPYALRASAAVAPPWPVLASVGAAIGLLAGLTGTGGGIFLSPLLILAGWAGARETAGVAAALIFVNSAAGLAGNLSSFGQLDSATPLFIGAVVIGGTVGSLLSATRLPREAMLRCLSVVMAIAGLKLVLS